jgi:integrase/recombinase XerD
MKSFHKRARTRNYEQQFSGCFRTRKTREISLLQTKTRNPPSGTLTLWRNGFTALSGKSTSTTSNSAIYLFRKVRSLAGIRQEKKQRKLPKLLSDAELKRFFDGIQAGGSVEHQIMLKLLFFAAIRVSELVGIKAADVDLGNCKIFIDQGKGSKDRNVLFPESFRLVIAGHLAANPRNKFLFESGQCRPYSTRRIQQIVTDYGERAGIKIHPHLLRHQMLTWLTRSGLTDAQIQLISGHSSKKSLEVYQHMGLGSVEKVYQDAVRIIQ